MPPGCDRPCPSQPRESVLNIHDHAERYAPHVLSIVRIVAALLFLEHGTSHLFGWPSPLPSPALFSMMVVMALATTFMTTPMLEWIYPVRAIRREQSGIHKEYAYTET